MMNSTGKETLLIVDDEQDTLDLCHRLFQKHYRILIATSGATALELAQGENIAAALVDQRMPGMSGLDLLLVLQGTHPDTARIAMTAYTDLETIVSLVNSGRIHGFILKPWNNHDFKNRVDREVESYCKTRIIRVLNDQLIQEHRDMLAILRDLDPNFEVPKDNGQLKKVRSRLRQRVSTEAERLFLHELLKSHKGNVLEAARAANINRTLLYRLMKRAGIDVREEDTSLN